MKYAEVVLPVPIRHTLTYRLPQTLESRAIPGMRVRVPLGSRRMIGCLLGEASDKPDIPLKDVLEIPDEEPILSPLQIQLLRWAAAYYLTPPGEVLRHLLPPALFRTGKSRAERPSKPFPLSEKFRTTPPAVLTRDQKEAVSAILQGCCRDSPPPFLIHGITGSGKTEVYREVIRQLLQEGGQALVLVPEIGLTPQTTGRFQSLGVPTAVTHSALTPAQRRQIWNGVRTGEISLVVATRSGIFLPFSNLRVIVIDEEHDSSYKQEERFCYHARDLALWRGKQQKIPILLGSATPSVESLHRAATGKMEQVRLTERPAGASLPAIEMIDRRREGGADSILSERLAEALRTNLKRRKQSLLFLNRRGFSPFVLCRVCGNVPRCDRCTISLTLHKNLGGEPPSLVCHYCDVSHRYHPVCSRCRKGTMAPHGFGTERVASEIGRLFPNARVARLDRDASKGKAWLQVLERMKKREIDILIGTQMITKGHDYPDLTLVGILDADQSLHLPDFRAGERTFQLITQVSGRAGRGTTPGSVYIQTYRPDHPPLRASTDGHEKGFYEKEFRDRAEAGYPPFKRLIEIRLTGSKVETVQRQLALLTSRLHRDLSATEVSILGPAPCPMERVRGRCRWHLLLKTGCYAKIQPKLGRLLDRFAADDLSSNARMLVNVDPVEML